MPFHASGGSVMPLSRIARSAVPWVLSFGLLASPAAAQRASKTGTPTRMIVTVEPKKGSKVPTLYREDVFVFEGQDRDGVVDWMPLQGNNAALELFILIDDGLSGGFAHQIEDLRTFLDKLPPSTAVGVGYMQNGAVKIAQNITTDHKAAAKVLRVPAGVHGTPASPYACLSQLMAGWPNDPVRREILFISDGVDGLFRAGAQNPYVDQAIATAQQGNIIVHAMFARGSGFQGMSGGLMTWGQSYESQITHATGGAFYFMDFGSGPSITPYLQDLARKLDHQFLLAFLAKPEKKAGPRSVKLKTEVANASLIAPEKVYVAAAK